MNRFKNTFGLPQEATLRLLDGEFQVVSNGDFVRCSVTGIPIQLQDLRYWNVERQEVYATPQLALQRHQELATKKS